MRRPLNVERQQSSPRFFCVGMRKNWAYWSNKYALRIINTSIKGVLRLPFSEQRTLLRMLKNEQWLFNYILYKGNRSVNIIFKHQIIRICLSVLYKILLVVKSIIK